MTSNAATVRRVLDTLNKKNADLAVGKNNNDLPVISIEKSSTYDSNFSLATYAYGGRTLTSNECNEVSKRCNDRCSFSTPSFLNRIGDHFNSMVLAFYGNIEAGAEATCSTSPAAFHNIKPSNMDARIKSSKSEHSVARQAVALDDEESSVVTAKTEYGAEVSEQAQPSCCLVSLFGCSDGNQQGNVDVNQDDRNDGFSLDTDTFTLDESLYSPRSNYNVRVDYLTPKAQALLREINDVLIKDDMQKSASFEASKHDEIKAMIEIKKHLLEQQEFLKGAPEDAKRDFYRAITRAATLNAEAAAQQAELKLKRIRLESLRVQEEMDRLSGGNETFDSSVDGSEIKHGLKCFHTTVTTKKSINLHTNRNGQVTAE